MVCRQHDLLGSGKYSYDWRLFPEPLTKEKESYFLRMIHTEQQKEAREVLIQHNLRLVNYIAGKYYRFREEPGELFSIGTIGLIQAINSYDSEKDSRLSAYAAVCIENEILMFLRGRKKQYTEISIEEVVCMDEDGNEQYIYETIACEEDDPEEQVQREESRRIVQKAMRNLTEAERRVIILRYGMDKTGGEERTQSEAAEILGVSQSYLSRVEKRALARLRQEMSENDLLTNYNMI